MLPNAWPSATMLANSVFVKIAVSKSWTTYMRTIISFSPIHAVGLIYFMCLGGTLCFTNQHYSFFHRMRAIISCVVMCSWPLGFLLGLTLIGSLGSGYQSRFLLPALPGTAILTAISISRVSESYKSEISVTNFSSDDYSGCRYAIAVILIALGAMHTLFYSVLYPTMFADLEFSVFEIIGTILKSPLRPVASPSAFDEILNYLRHFGLNRKSS